jgi:hypothetical protein
MAARPWDRCYRRPARCRSYSRMSPIPSARASSIACRGQAATPRDLHHSNTAPREMARTSQGDRAKRDASGCYSGRCHINGARPICSDPGVAPSLGVEVSAVNVRDPNEIERAVMTFAQTSNGGLIGTGSALAVIHRQLIVTLTPGISCPLFTSNVSLSPTAASSPMGLACCGRLRRSNPQGREASRSSGSSFDQIRLGNQSQDCQGAWHHGAAIAARARRRGHRVNGERLLFALSGHRLVRCTCLLLTQSGHP